MPVTSPAPTVERLTGTTGVRIHDIDLNDLSDDAFATIRQALLAYGVVHLPGQAVTPVAHKAFGLRFGPLHTHPGAPGVEGHPEILLLQNHGKSHSITEVWHSDVTCEARPPTISILAARVLPDVGDVLLWDNRSVMHFAVHDDGDQTRVMHRVTVAGDELR